MGRNVKIADAARSSMSVYQKWVGICLSRRKKGEGSMSGFTLIEVVIVIAIVGISSGIILASMTSSQRVERETETAARKFAALVREAQNDALTGKQLVASTDPCYYQIGWGEGRTLFSMRRGILPQGYVQHLLSSHRIPWSAG